MAERLRIYFDRQVDDIDTYVATVEAECAAFPEGTLFPYILPALAYGNLAMKNPERSANSVAAMAALIRPSLTAFQRNLDAPDAPLLKLESYSGRATEMGQINLALSLYAQLGGRDDQLLELNRHFTKLLSHALEESEGRPLRSYPYLTWPFDTMPCVVSLRLHAPENPNYRKIADQHLAWIASQGLHAQTGLPYGEARQGLSRGCDLSLRLPLMRHFAPNAAARYYEKYLEWHWSALALGFREWPKGHDRGIDIDSGPIFRGIGLSATGNGIAATLAFQDKKRSETLLSLLEQRDMWVALYRSNDAIRGLVQREFEDAFVPIDTTYFTGFLYGDTALFYMLTWEDYGL